MADGNRSAKGKQVAVDDRDEHGLGSPTRGGGGGGGGAEGAEPSHRRQVHPASYWSVGGAAFVEPFVNPYDGSGYDVSYGAGGGNWIGAGTPGAVGWNGAGTSGGSGSYGASNGGASSYGVLGNGGGSRAVDRRGGGYGGMGFLPENPVGGGGSTHFPSTSMDAPMYAPRQHHPGPRYWPASSGIGSASFPSPFTGAGAPGPQHAGPGYWPHSNGGGSSSSLPSPFTGAGTSGPQHPGPGYWPAGNGGGSAPFPSPLTGAGAGIPGPHHARTGNSWHTGAEHFHYRGNGNGNGGGGSATTFPSPHPHIGDGMYATPYHAPNGGRPRSPSPLDGYMEQLDSFISRSLTSLSVRDRGSESLLARGRRHLYNLVNHGSQELQLNAGDLQNAPFPGPDRGHGDPYAGRRLEDVRGAMSGVARNVAGCQFLLRMVAEGGAAAAEQVFEELAGEIVWLMADRVAYELVEKLVDYCTDEQVTRVLHILAASPPNQIVAVARNHAGSNILQTLVGRLAGNPGHAELFTSTLARAGEHGVVSLMEHSDASRLIIRCLDTFSIYQNRFITAVVASNFFLRRLCRDRHGCTVVNRCIDKAAGDEQLLRSIVHAVCRDGIALAEHGYGNFVVQNVMRSVPEARDWLHGQFRGWYVRLSRQKPSSHVVQGCLEHFSPEQADEIVTELLGCNHWDCTFRHLITDPFANYVLQSAIKRKEIQMHNPLMDAISMHSHSLQGDRFAREVFRKMREVISGVDT